MFPALPGGFLSTVPPGGPQLAFNLKSALKIYLGRIGELHYICIQDSVNTYVCIFVFMCVCVCVCVCVYK